MGAPETAQSIKIRPKAREAEAGRGFGHILLVGFRAMRDIRPPPLRASALHGATSVNQPDADVTVSTR